MTNPSNVRPIPGTVRKTIGLLILGLTVVGGGVHILSNMAAQVG